MVIDLAERALRAAQIQVGRIWNHRQTRAGDMTVYGDILIDVHFYFISLRNVYRFLDKAVEQPVGASLKPRLETLNDSWFRHYSAGREAFEHIDQRLPGERHQAKIVEISEGDTRRKVHYGLRMGEGLFAHSDKTWDITESKFVEIERNVRQLIEDYVRLCDASGAPPARCGDAPAV